MLSCRRSVDRQCVILQDIGLQKGRVGYQILTSIVYWNTKYQDIQLFITNYNTSILLRYTEGNKDLSVKNLESVFILLVYAHCVVFKWIHCITYTCIFPLIGCSSSKVNIVKGLNLTTGKLKIIMLPFKGYSIQRFKTCFEILQYFLLRWSRNKVLCLVVKTSCLWLPEQVQIRHPIVNQCPVMK